MAAEGEVCPKRVTESYYDDRVTTRPTSLLRRTSRGGASNYYSSFDNSVSVYSNGASTTLDSPVPEEYLDDSSDHEREDDKETTHLVGNSRSVNYQRLDSSKEDAPHPASIPAGGEDNNGQEEGNDDRIKRCDKEDVVREDIPPYTLSCTLIPSWIVKQCKLRLTRSPRAFRVSLANSYRKI